MLPQLVLLGALRSEPLSAERAPPIYNKDTAYKEYILNVYNMIANILIYVDRKVIIIQVGYMQQRR